MSNPLVWIGLIFISVLLVVLFRRQSKKQLITGRDSLDFSDIYSSVDKKISFDTFSEVLNVLGNSYSVNPQLLRPTDSLQKIHKMDSWSLGAGDEKMGQWLMDKGIKDVDENKLYTISDLMVLVESHKV